MTTAIMPRQPAWWIWTITVALLALGLAGIPGGFAAAIGLSLAQTVHHWRRQRSLAAMSVQIRLAYAALLVACRTPGLRGLYWIPAAGTLALVLFGYCLMARTLSLLPWNRREKLTVGLIRRTFFSAPVIRRLGGASSGCGAPEGVCELEARAASPPVQPDAFIPTPNLEPSTIA